MMQREKDLTILRHHLPLIEHLESRRFLSAQIFSGQQFSAGTDPSSIAAGDFNGDSKPDLVSASNTSSTVSVLLNNGSGAFASVQSYAVGSNPNSVTCGDFNGDGKPDIITANYSGNNVSVLS